MTTAKSAPAAKKGSSKGKSKINSAPLVAPQTKMAPPTETHTVTEEQRHHERRAEDQARSKQNGIAFSAQQLSAPTVPPQAAATPAKPAIPPAFLEELKALQEKHGVQLPVKVASPRTVRDNQNGITRPAPETKCGQIWAAADEITATTHQAASIAALRLHSATQGINEHTIRTQYARWRQYNGVSGRVAAPVIMPGVPAAS